MTKEEYSDFCGCDDSIRVDRENRELKELIKLLNCGKPIDQPATQRGIITERLPVAEAKIQLRLKRYDKLKKGAKMIIAWYKDLEAKYDKLKDENAKLREGMK